MKKTAELPLIIQCAECGQRFPSERAFEDHYCVPDFDYMVDSQ